MKKNFTMRQPQSWAMRMSVLMLATLLLGCTAVRLSYNNGETIVFWWLNAYVGFEPDQQSWTRKHIDTLFGWHRATQLKNYVLLLTLGQKQLQENVTKEMLLADYEQAKKQALVSLDQSVPALADLALSLRPQQLVQLQKKFVSNNEDYRKDYLRGDTVKRQAFRYKKILKQAESWFGPFSREQEQLIRKASDARPLNNDMWLTERVLRQTELITLLLKIQTEKPSHDATMAMLKAYANAVLNHFDQAERVAFFNNSTDSTIQMVAQIVNLASPTQKAHAHKKLQQWIDDLHFLGAATH